MTTVISTHFLPNALRLKSDNQTTAVAALFTAPWSVTQIRKRRDRAKARLIATGQDSNHRHAITFFYLAIHSRVRSLAGASSV
jgi:hypothetical protein